MNIINGYAGCGKKIHLEKAVNELISSGCLPQKICIISMNPNNTIELQEKLKNKNIYITSFNSFINNILKNNPLTMNSTLISDYLAEQIIFSIAKKELIQNESMKNLTKSDGFIRELYNIFGLYKVNKIIPEKLYDILESATISQEDKNRFRITIKIYEQYCNIMKEHRLLDYKDAVQYSILLLQRNSFVKNNLNHKYSHIYITDAQELNPLQMELINLIAEGNELILYGDKNSNTQKFMGANIFNPEKTDLQTSIRNDDILTRALVFTGESNLEFGKTDAIEYHNFNDFQSEIDYIAQDIIKRNNNGTKYTDFAILVRDSATKQNVSEMLKNYDIPLNSEFQSEEFDEFKQKLTNILEICNLLEKLQIMDFDYNEFIKDTNIASAVDLENLSSQFNEYIKALLYETFNNKIYVEKLVSLKNKYSELYLPVVFVKYKQHLPENEVKAVNKMFLSLKYFYNEYKKNNFIEIVTHLSQLSTVKDDVFHKFLAKFITGIYQLSQVKKSVLKEDIDYKLVLDLMDIVINDNSSDEDRVCVTTFFKSAGCEYKYVYIPTMIENYFPKKIKSTQFISEEANSILSKKINDLFPNFTKIILSDKEELKDENSLMYVAMTRAKERLLISTHTYEGKKTVIPSQYFEQLTNIDSQNVHKNNIDKNENDLNVVNEYDIEDAIKDDIVIGKDEELTISASSISDFLSCPRKFYYSRLLNLNTESTYSASFGTLVHAIFENMLNNYLDEYSVEKFKEIGKILFTTPIDKDAVINAGFKERILEKLETLDALSLKEMENDYYYTIDNLYKIGCFMEKPTDAHCEKSFIFSLDEIPNVKIKGSIDAIIKTESGWKIVDYKTGKDKKKLERIISEDGVNFISRKKYSETAMREYEYQIPIYYLASEFSDEIKKISDNISETGYLYIRPPYKHDGSKRDFIQTENIEIYKDKIIDNIKTCVVDEIRNRRYFEARHNYLSCLNCAFKDICEENNEDSDD